VEGNGATSAKLLKRKRGAGADPLREYLTFKTTLEDQIVVLQNVLQPSTSRSAKGPVNSCKIVRFLPCDALKVVMPRTEIIPSDAPAEHHHCLPLGFFSMNYTSKRH
jgi:hypothetical protein